MKNNYEVYVTSPKIEEINMSIYNNYLNIYNSKT